MILSYALGIAVALMTFIANARRGSLNLGILEFAEDQKLEFITANVIVSLGVGGVLVLLAMPFLAK